MGIWKEDTGRLTKVVVEGDEFGDTDAIVSTVWRTPQINASGDVAFTGRITSGTGGRDTDLATFVAEEGELRIALREGQPMPGVDYVFREEAVRSVQFNDQGMLAFRAWNPGLDGARLVTSNSLWIDNGGTPRLVLTEGDAIEIGPNDIRFLKTVRDFRLNNLGQVALLAGFADGTTAILRSNSFAVPEPTTLLGGGLLIMFAFMARRNNSATLAKPQRSQPLSWSSIAD